MNIFRRQMRNVYTRHLTGVKVYNVIFNQINVLCDVPLGDHLSPLLFSLFINGINNILKHSNSLFLVDDTKIS